MKKITTLIPILAMVGTTAIAVPTISSCSCASKSASQHIKKLTSSSSVEITDQNSTTATYTFEANDTSLSGDNLTALIKVESDQTTNFSVTAKGYVFVENGVITLTVTFSAAAITSINDECKFDVYFTNADPNDTWAEKYAGLSIKYTSPFLNSNLSTQQYVFSGKPTGRRQMSINLAENAAVTSVSASAEVVEGDLELGEITEIEIKNNTITLMLPYNSKDLSEQTTSKCKLTLTTNNFTKTFEMSITTVDDVYPINTEYSVSQGSSYSSYCFSLSLPLSDTETIADFTTIEITDISSDSTITPEFATTAKGELSSEKDYITFYLRIKDSQIVKDGQATFSIHLIKKDNKESGGTQGWNKTITGLKLKYTGRALTLTQNEFDFTSAGTISSGNLLTINVPFEANGTFSDSELPEDITFKTHAVSPSTITYLWETMCDADSKNWVVSGNNLRYETVWEFDMSWSYTFESGVYTHTIEFDVEWGSGTKYTKQVFYFTIKGNYEA